MVGEIDNQAVLKEWEFPMVMDEVVTVGGGMAFVRVRNRNL